MILLHKRKIAAVVCTALLATAGVVNYINHSESQSVSFTIPPASESYEEETSYGEAKYVSSELTLEKERSEAVALLKTVSEDESADPDKKAQAQGEMIRIAQDMEKETLTQRILEEKGFQNVQVFLSSPDATVSVQSEGLSPKQIAQIRDTMKSEAGIEPKNLKIIETN